MRWASNVGAWSPSTLTARPQDDRHLRALRMAACCKADMLRRRRPAVEALYGGGQVALENEYRAQQLKRLTDGVLYT